MRRREFITLLSGSAAALPFAAWAQQGESVRRVGVIMNGSPSDTEQQGLLAMFVQSLQKMGWVDGRNVRIETRWGGGIARETRKNAEELVALAPDVILATGSAAMTPLLEATRTVPVVFNNVADHGRTATPRALFSSNTP